MKTSAPRSARKRAFTLIELLTVIAIIAILVGLLFPTVNAVREAARRAQAKNDVQNIVAAVKAYYTEYGKYPNVSGTSDTDDAQGDADTIVGDQLVNAVADNKALFNILRAIDREPNNGHIRNPRKIVFFEGKSVANPEAPKAGFLDKKPDGGGGNMELLGCFFDPWGKQYNVIMDTSYDNYLNLDQVYTDFSGAPPDGDRPHTGVGAWSLGKDGKIGENGNKKYRDKKKLSDDVISWQ